jgi:hypothetical protein
MRQAVVLAFAWLLSMPLHAQDTWTFTTADFHRSVGVLKSIDDHAAHVAQSNNPDLTIPLDSLLRAERATAAAAAAARPTTAAPKFALFLQNGDRLTGEPVALKDDILTWSTAAVGSLQFPVQELRAFTRLAALPGIDDDRKEDQVALSNHDVVRGAVIGIEDAKILIQTGGDTVPLPLTSADSILFASPARQPPPPVRCWRVRLVDGSTLTVPALRAADNKLAFDATLAKDGKARSTDLANILTLEQLNGPVSWLSDRVPTINEQIPFNSEATYPARMDRSVFGKPLRVGSQTFDKGIGVHANARLVFPLDGQYKLLRTRYAIDTGGDAGSSAAADVNIRILLDGKVVHEHQHFKAFKLSPLITVELGNAKELTLEVTAGGVTDTQDRFDWIEAALIREPPPPPPAPPPPTSSPTTTPAPTTRAADKG